MTGSKKEIPVDPEFMALLEASSLGTPNAKRIRALTPVEVLREILARSDEMRRT